MNSDSDSSSRSGSSGAAVRPSGGWSPPSPEELQRQLPQYEIVSVLGYGGMGAVYKGRQISLDRPVAIKILPPEVQAGNEETRFVECFKNEARSMARMNHPGIVGVYDFGETPGGQLYLVMEFVDGTDVAQMIKSQSGGRGMPPDHALAIAAHVCDALGYAHGHGIIHRDIKPANILMNREGRVKIADFGLAKVMGAGSTGITRTNVAMGTPDYIAPEALIVGMPVDHRADLYAVGVMLYQMLTGEVPRGAFKTPSQKVGCDPRFDAIVLKAVQTEVGERYQSAAEIRRDLDHILTVPMAKPAQGGAVAGGKRAAVHRPGQAEPAAAVAAAEEQAGAGHKSKSRVNPLVPVAIAFVVLVAGVFGFLTIGGKKTSEPGQPEVAPAPVAPVPIPRPVPAAPAGKAATPKPLVAKPKADPKPATAVAAMPVVTPPPSPAPAPSPVLTPITEPKPRPSAPVSIPLWLQEARKIGGKVKFFGTGPNGATEKGRAEEFGDVAEVAVRQDGWIVRRKNGEVHGVGWGKTSEANPTGATPVGPFPVSRITHGAVTDMRVATDGSYRNVWGGGSQHRRDLARKESVAVANIHDHLMALGSNGEILVAVKWNGTPHPPPTDLFQGATTFAGFRNSYVVAKPASGVLGWQVWDQKVTEFPAEIRDVTDIRAGPDCAILLTKSGRVFVTDEAGETVGKASLRVPAGLAPAIAVRAGRNMCAAQMTDGTWVAWGDSPRLIERIRAAGPALDVGFDYGTANSEFMLWIEAPGKAGVPLASSSAPPAVAGSDLLDRLGQIAAQFQTAYDRDIAPAHGAAVSDLDSKYFAAINRALAAATQAGNLDESVKLREELQRVTDKGRMPTVDLDSVPEPLRKLRDTYRTALAKLEQDRDKKAEPYYDRYDELLDAYQKELTRQNRLDDALKVKMRRDELARERDTAASAVAEAANVAPPPTASTPGRGKSPVAPPVPAAPSKPLKVPPGTTVKSVVEWVTAGGGSVRIRAEGKEQNIGDPAELPNGTFEVIRVNIVGEFKSDVTDETFATLSILKSLETIYAVGNRLKARSLASFAGLNKLKEITIMGGEGLAESELRHLSGLPLLDTLRLGLKDRTGEGCEGLRGLPNLKRLELSGAGRLSAKGAEAIATLTTLVELSPGSLDRASQSRLGPIAALPNLERFTFAEIEPTATGFGIVAKAPKLMHLDLVNVRGFSTRCFPALAPAAAHLVEIDLRFSRGPNDTHIKEIVAALPNLESYGVRYGKNDATAAGLHELAKLPRLKWLGWCGAKVEDYAELASFPALTEVHITGRDVTDEILKHLKNIPNLKTASLQETSVTKAAVEAFKQERPGVAVSGY